MCLDFSNQHNYFEIHTRCCEYQLFLTLCWWEGFHCVDITDIMNSHVHGNVVFFVFWVFLPRIIYLLSCPVQTVASTLPIFLLSINSPWKGIHKIISMSNISKMDIVYQLIMSWLIHFISGSLYSNSKWYILGSCFIRNHI